jgi:hypothetical protein
VDAVPVIMQDGGFFNQVHGRNVSPPAVMALASDQQRQWRPNSFIACHTESPGNGITSVR